MTLTMQYTDGFDETKSMDTVNELNIILGQDGVSYDFDNAQSASIKIGNAGGYIMDIPVDLDDMEDKTLGTLSIPLDQQLMDTLPPDIYYMECWVMTEAGRMIFPSAGVLAFTIDMNIESGIEGISRITLVQFEERFDNLSKTIIQAQANNSKATSDAVDSVRATQAAVEATLSQIQSNMDDAKTKYNTYMSEGQTKYETLAKSTQNQLNDAKTKYDEYNSSAKATLKAIQDAASGTVSVTPAVLSDTIKNLNWQKFAITDDSGGIKTYEYTDANDVLMKLSKISNGMETIYIDKGAVNLPTNDNLRGVSQVQNSYGYAFFVGEVTGDVWSASFTSEKVVWNQLNKPVDSAYDLAVKGGFKGTQEEWLLSLKGSDGKDGTQVDLTKYVKTADMTTAISTATANMVDSTKATNFTAGLQSGGVNVATAADLKSIENSAWHLATPSDNAYIKNVRLLYKAASENGKSFNLVKFNLSGTLMRINGPSTQIPIFDFSSVISSSTQIGASINVDCDDNTFMYSQNSNFNPNYYMRRNELKLSLLNNVLYLTTTSSSFCYFETLGDFDFSITSNNNNFSTQDKDTMPWISNIVTS